MRFGLGGSLSKRGGKRPPRLLRLCLCLDLAMEVADGLGLCVMQMVDADRVVDPVASRWNEVHIDRCVVAGDVCGPGHGLQKPDEVHVDRSWRRAISPTHGSVVAGDACGLAHCLQKPDE